MARKPATKTDGDVGKGSKSSGLMGALIGANTKKFGVDAVVVANKVRIYVIEPYSLALQWLFDLGGIPLQSLVLCSGAAKSYKTTLLLEMMRIAMSSSEESAGVISNTEGKWSVDRAQSSLGDMLERVMYMAARTNEEWQDLGSNTLKTALELREKDDTPVDIEVNPFGAMPPIVMGIDSLTGAQTEDLQTKVITEGHGEKTFQDRAIKNWMWFNTWRPRLVGVPVLIMVTQHLKDGIGGPVPTKVTAGGTAAGFMCDIEIRCARIKEISLANATGAVVKWTIHHNSLGADRRFLEVPIYEGYSADNKPTTRFGWDKALIDLLIRLMDGDKQLGPRLIQALGGRIEELKKGGVGSVYTCPALGITPEVARTDNVTASVLGARLQEYGSEMRAKLREALRVNKGITVWQEKPTNEPVPGDDDGGE